MRKGLALAGALLLAACAQGPSGFAPGPISGPTSGPKSGAAPVVRPAPDPAALLGVAPAEIERPLGAPAFDGRDGAARIWRYSPPGCTLIVVFYGDETGADRSAHIEARRPEGGAADTRICLGVLVNLPRA